MVSLGGPGSGTQFWWDRERPPAAAMAIHLNCLISGHYVTTAALATAGYPWLRSQMAAKIWHHDGIIELLLFYILKLLIL